MGLRWIYARLDSLAEWSCVRPDLKIWAIMNWHHDLLFGICNVNKSSFLEACRGCWIYDAKGSWDIGCTILVGTSFSHSCHGGLQNYMCA